MSSEQKCPKGRTRLPSFWMTGILLLFVFLVSVGIWLAMRTYERQVEREYDEAALTSTQQPNRENTERFLEIERKYWSLHHGFSRRRISAGTTAAVSGIGLFLWFLTLLGKGIRWLAERTL